MIYGINYVQVGNNKKRTQMSRDFDQSDNSALSQALPLFASE